MRLKKGAKVIVAFMLVASFCSFSQPKDSTEKTSVPKIYLSSVPKILAGGVPAGIAPSEDPAAGNVFYFTFDPAVEGKKINYTGSNLAKALQPVPAAYRELKTYRNLRVTAPVLLLAGIAAIAATTGYQMLHKDRFTTNAYDTPDFAGVGAGIGLCLSSAIPEYFSQGKIEKAVDLYNAHASDTAEEDK